MYFKLLGYHIKDVFPLQRRKVDFLVFISLFNFFMLFLLTPLFLLEGDLGNGSIYLINGLIYLIPILLLRDRDPEKSYTFFVVTYFVSQTFHLFFSGGFRESDLVWLLMANISNFYFLGTSKGIIGGVYTALILFALYGLIQVGVEFEEMQAFRGGEQFSFIVSILILILLVGKMLYAQELENKDYKKSLDTLNHKLNRSQIIGETGAFWKEIGTDKLEFSEGLLNLVSLDRVSIDTGALNNIDIPEIIQRIHPSDRKKAASRVEEILEGTDIEAEVIVRSPLPNGGNRYLKISGSKDEQNEVVYGVLKNVTQQFEANKSFEDYKNALDQSALVSIADRSGKIIYANQKFCDISGYAENELLGKDHKIISSREHEPEFWRSLWSTISNGGVWRGIVKNQGKTNNLFWVDTTIVPFLDEKGRPDYYVAIRFDVTDQMRSQTEIMRKNKELEQFSYVLSHDLKSPLRAIKTLIHFIKEDMEDEGLKLPEEIDKNFGLIDDRVVRMEALIMSVLSYAQVGKGKESEWIDMNELIGEVVEFIEVPKNFKLMIAKDLPKIFMNRVELKQVTQNLITNAIKYNDKEEPTLSIYPGLRSKTCLIHFKDNGKGIDPIFHEKVFNLFETLKQKDSYESTGIGLPIVKKAIEQAGGKIEIKSKVGEGADFIIQFPMSICEL